MISQIPSVLIVYPPEFACYTKFQRKINRILSNIEQFRILYFSDSRKFIFDYFKDKGCLPNIFEIENINNNINEITHAILFDNGICLKDLRNILDDRKIIYRIISIQITKIVNIDLKEKYDIYIGRGSGWGNPYAIGFDGDREEVIRKFKYDFDMNLLKDGVDFKNKLLSLKGKILGCHCKPLSCHGDVLVEYLNSHDDNQ